MAAKKRTATRATKARANASAASSARGGTRGEAKAGKKVAARAAKKAPLAKPRANPAKPSSPAKPASPAKAGAERGAPAAKTVKRAPAAQATTKAARASAASGASAAAGPAVGDRAPKFSLHDHLGQALSSGDLAGTPYVIYFYPKDDTPGCTTEACGFRDAGAEFEGAGVRVLGVSPDSVASHQRFASKYGLPFTLLSDPAQELATSYGVWALKKNYGREYMGIVRSTFLVDGQGVIRHAWRAVRVNGHVAEVQAAASALS